MTDPAEHRAAALRYGADQIEADDTCQLPHHRAHYANLLRRLADAEESAAEKQQRTTTIPLLTLAATLLDQHARDLAEQITALGEARGWSTWAADYIHPDREFVDTGAILAPPPKPGPNTCAALYPDDGVWWLCTKHPGHDGGLHDRQTP